MRFRQGLVVDAFAGAGGWDVGAYWAGLPQPIGLEWDAAACQTRAAAGLLTIRCDVSEVPTALLVGLEGFVASPPCTLFSQAGSKVARTVLHLLYACMDSLAEGIDNREETRAAIAVHITPSMTKENARRKVPLGPDALARKIADTAKLATLVVEPVRFIHDCRPRWFALEQVPSVLPLWQHLMRLAKAWGYAGEAATLCAADYGVGQERYRAIAVGSLDFAAAMPSPTHAEHPADDLFGASTKPWVTMAQALGWGMTAAPSPTVVGGASRQGAHDALDGGAGSRRALRAARDAGEFLEVGGGHVVTTRGNSGREHDEFDPAAKPSRVVTSKTDSWRLVPGGSGYDDPHRRTYDPATEPAPTIAFGHVVTAWRWTLTTNHKPTGEEYQETDAGGRPAPTVTSMTSWWHARRNDQSESGESDPDWPEHRPATTVAGRDLVPDPGSNANRFNGRDKSRNDGYRVTEEEAATLQSFPPNFPWRGTKSARFLQIGNAFPPVVAMHVLAQFAPKAAEADPR